MQSRSATHAMCASAALTLSLAALLLAPRLVW
jgi:hypothetical protein